jgi:hypothetical protein
MPVSSEADLLAEVQRMAKAVERELCGHVLDRGRLAVVQAPPGSGKTTLLLKAVQAATRGRLRIAVATQTNSQADDICIRLARDYPSLRAIRFAGSGTPAVDLGRTIAWETVTGNLPTGPCIVVGTSAKWGMVDIARPFDVVFVEEAWQLGWADFMLLGQVSGAFVLIGDPGQIPPVVSVDVARWETSPRPPHLAAPKVILADPTVRFERWNLPATRRLPRDSAELVRPFYDFDFQATAAPLERAIALESGSRTSTDRTLDLLREGSVAGFTLPTPSEGPPLEEDPDVARAAAQIVSRLLSRRPTRRWNGASRKLEPWDIGISATHRVMNTALDLALPRALRGQVKVDTPERWQGLERPIMIVVHPLSGVVRPSAFDLETGRLCVMASRHLAGMIVLSRDHIGDTLERFIPSADQPVGRPDVAGRGHLDNLTFWSQLVDRQRVVAA